MQLPNQAKMCIIVGSGLVGGIYGSIAVACLRGNTVLLSELIICAVSGAALFASSASALCRFFEVWTILRKNRSQPSDYSLIYRGLRVSADVTADEDSLDLSDASTAKPQDSPSETNYDPSAAKWKVCVISRAEAVPQADSTREIEFIELLICEPISPGGDHRLIDKRRVSPAQLKQELRDLMSDYALK